MLSKISKIIISFILSIGLTLMVKPYIAVYVKSEIIINMLYIAFTIVGFAVIYQVLNKKL